MDRLRESRGLGTALLILVLLGILFLLVQIEPLLRTFFSFLKAVLGPFLVAVIISYLLNPVVNLLANRLVPRSLAVLFIYSLFIGAIAIVLTNLVPLFNLQLKELSEHLPEWNMRLQSWIDQYNHSKDALPESVRLGVEKSLNRLEESVTDGVGNLMSSLGTTINQLLIAVIVPFLAFYMLKDVNVIEKALITLLPVRRRKDVIRLFRDVDEALGNYVRGQLLVCLAVGILAYIGYLIIGLPYPLILALLVGVFNVIPYLGPFFGAVPALLVALSISKEMVIAVILVNLVVQVLEGNVLSPQIVGRTLHMHPLFIIFALLVGGELGGILGLILAVPLFAVGKVIVEHVVDHYTKKPT
ncbi:putative PurR-regulated permease PerM [Melghirimyces profundicolus]|uniref:Putative PurR-regulated permease PerM n=1 Tax=Melghirimyces profundicolus TaxID=1242148 RepID=A0A2T6BQW8_9BACL|nr:AI-2E family transporter [Melghirimyces profundicolus]PTX58439.1 putative PurR-regulated permease PerM [Melghirimyces profundicolus]